jgi:hypothetical protein
MGAGLHALRFRLSRMAVCFRTLFVQDEGGIEIDQAYKLILELSNR